MSRQADQVLAKLQGQDKGSLLSARSSRGGIPQHHHFVTLKLTWRTGESQSKLQRAPPTPAQACCMLKSPSDCANFCQKTWGKKQSKGRNGRRRPQPYLLLFPHLFPSSVQSRNPSLLLKQGSSAYIQGPKTLPTTLVLQCS